MLKNIDKIKFFCVTNKEIDFIKKNNHHLCWVGNSDPPDNYIRCDNKLNIFDKEKYYSELTFHYWFWKNMLSQENHNQWIGFCQKRRYWVNTKNVNLVNKENINQYLFDNLPIDWNQYDVILCKPLDVSGVKKIKMLKRGFKNILKDPLILFNKKKQNLHFHFDMHHGFGNLQKAIKMLNKKDQVDFESFMKNNTLFNPHIMFISKPKIMNLWFENLFSWLESCEKQFNFQDLKGYDTQRLFAYLAERFLSYWFKKNFKYKEIDWVQLDNF